MIKLLEKIITLHPWTLILILPLIVLILCAIYWTKIKEMFGNLFNKKNPLEEHCGETQNTYVFKSMMIYDSYNDLFIPMQDSIFRAIRNKKKVVFDLSHINKTNDNSREAIRDIVRDAIKKDNVSMMVVFPKNYLESLYDELVEFLKRYNPENVIVKLDQKQNKTIYNYVILKEGVNSIISIIDISENYSDIFVNQLKKWVLHTIDEGLTEKFVFDISNVGQLSSSLIGVIVEAKKRADAVIISGNSDLVHTAIHVTGLDKMVNVYETVELIKWEHKGA